jgi:hypothetical protein
MMSIGVTKGKRPRVYNAGGSIGVAMGKRHRVHNAGEERPGKRVKPDALSLSAAANACMYTSLSHGARLLPHAPASHDIVNFTCCNLFSE